MDQGLILFWKPLDIEFDFHALEICHKLNNFYGKNNKFVWYFGVPIHGARKGKIISLGHIDHWDYYKKFVNLNIFQSNIQQKFLNIKFGNKFIG